MSLKRKISEIIFKGPESIHNKNYSVTYDRILNLMKLCFHSSNISKSYSIYVDNTNNKHKYFLNPIFRFTEYERIKNLKFPKVEYYKIPKKYFQAINTIILKVDAELQKTKFIKAGLILDRIPPNSCADIFSNFNSNFNIDIYRWNYCQKLNLSFGVPTGKPNNLTKTLIELMNFCDVNKNNFSLISIEESYDTIETEFLKKNYRKSHRVILNK